MTKDGLVFQVTEVSGLDVVADEIARNVVDYPVWLLVGEMGAGKTTLVKAVGRKLGVSDVVSSPTFSIINEYERPGSASLYHFDFYRIKDEREAYDIGADEYFYSGNPCFIEWPEKIPSLIPDRHGIIRIETTLNTHRTIVISVHDGEEKNRI